MQTPTNTTAAYTSFFAGTNSLKHKKRSIFSDNPNCHMRTQAQSCDNKVAGGEAKLANHDELFKFSSIKNYANMNNIGEGEESP
jgi:hypothetical protein